MRTYKLVLFGEGGVGKSSIVLQFIRKTFHPDSYDPTIEDNYVQTTCVDGELCLLDVLDTGGAIRVNQDHHIREGDGFMIIYSVTDPNSFKDVEIYWKKIHTVKDRNGYPILMIANKVDLVHSRVINETEGRAMAYRLQVPYLETSANNPPQNVDEAFHQAIRIIRDDSKNLSEENRCNFPRFPKSCTIL